MRLTDANLVSIPIRRTVDQLVAATLARLRVDIDRAPRLVFHLCHIYPVGRVLKVRHSFLVLVHT